MLFLVLFLLAMTLPGAGLVHLFKLDACRVALSISLSLGVLVLALLLVRALGLGTQAYGIALLCIYLAIAVAVGVTWGRGGRVAYPGAGIGHVRTAVVLTFGTVTAYMLWAGPYTEVPADVWYHIARINDRLTQVGLGDVGSLDGFDGVFDKLAAYWYTVAAFFMYSTATELEGALPGLAMANTLLFCAGVYAFSLFIFAEIVDEPSMRHWIAAASVFFFISHFGISVFSYVRYYVYAPTILGYVVYLAATACMLQFIRRDEGGWRYLIAAGGLTAVAAMVHLQEAIFVVGITGAVLIVEVMRLCGRGRCAGGVAYSPEVLTGKEKRVLVLVIAGGISYLAVHAWAYATVARHHPLAHAVLADIRNYLPFLQNLFILKPTYQFYQVITVWGVLVYVSFLVRARSFSRTPYLVAGMAMPVLTVFNPIFTDFFLRFSWPEVLWRMCYMLPLPFLGGYFLVTSARGAVRAPGYVSRAGCLVLAAALLVLLLPVRTTYFVSPYSKIYTLAPVAEANDHRIWDDLLAFLDTIDTSRVITDPVTGYVINGLTKHRYPGYKFYGARTMRVDGEMYQPRDFAKRIGWLTIVNQRDGAPSKTGKYGGHWPPDVMKVSGHYSEDFLDFVESKPGMFEKLWSQSRVTVYRVRREPETEPTW